MNYNTKSKSGFTIIEVVLVLAIAALIFLIVFLAVPALQRGQRDTQRRNDIGRALSAIQQSQSNNRGTLPTLDATFVGNYLTNGGSTFADPTTGNDYVFTSTSATGPSGVGGSSGDGKIYFKAQATCPNAGSTTFNTTGVGARNVALVVNLETGGQYCQSL